MVNNLVTKEIISFAIYEVKVDKRLQDLFFLTLILTKILAIHFCLIKITDLKTIL